MQKSTEKIEQIYIKAFLHIIITFELSFRNDFFQNGDHSDPEFIVHYLYDIF